MCQRNFGIISTIFRAGLDDVCYLIDMFAIVEPPAHLSQLTKEAGEVKV